MGGMLDDYVRYEASGSPSLANALPHWARAMLGCFTVEAKVRLLAGKYFPSESVTKEIGTDGGLLDLLFGKLGFSDEEKTFLRRCIKLRNKLIHCEPDKVRSILQEIDPTFQPPNLFKKFSVPEGGLTDAVVIDAVTNGTGGVNVVGTKSRDEGFMGWMLQAAGDGTFDRAAKIFTQAGDLINNKARLKPIA